MKLKHYVGHPTAARRRLGALLLAVISTSVGVATFSHSPAAAGSTLGVARKVDPIGTLAQDALWELRSNGDDPRAQEYVVRRDAVSSAIAARLSIDPAEMITAWSGADLAHQRALLAGLTQLGVPYRRNTSRPGVGFDCSGLTTYAWAGAGVTLVRQSSAQMRAAAPRTIDTAQAGDLMQYPGHVMMWLGVGRAALQAPNPGRSVEVVLYRSGRRVRIGDPTG